MYYDRQQIKLPLRRFYWINLVRQVLVEQGWMLQSVVVREEEVWIKR